MKKIFCVLLLLLLACSLVSCSDDEIPEGMQNVSTDDALFDLFVPTTWLPQNRSGVSGACVSSTDRSNVSVKETLPSENLTPKAYWETVCLPKYETGGVLQDFALIEDKCKETSLGGKDAMQYVFCFTLDGETYEVMQIIAEKDTMIYTLTYTATADRFATHVDTVENDIRANFRFR